MSVVVATPVVNGSQMPWGNQAHPLDPLSTAEILRACELLKAIKQLGASLRFAMVHLQEPPKAEVLAFKAGDPMERSAFLMVFDATTGETHEAVINVTRGTLVSWVQHVTDAAPYGQPPVLVEDFFDCADIVKVDEGWRNAVKRRGLTDEDIKLVQVDPFSAGNFGFPLEAGRRVVRAVSYYRESLKDNAYSHPIEGVVAVVDLIAKRVLQLVDDEVVVPIPRKKHNYDPESLGKPREDLKPLHISQPEGPSFSVDGWQVKWQKWSFRVGFTSREGLVLHQLGFDDGTGVRPVVYRASVTEMVVPYGDPNTSHFWKNAFDCGEYGLGKLANSLELGCDCLGLIHYFDMPMVDDFGSAALIKNGVCMHEEDYGILWKHFDFRTGLHQVRRSRRLVISFFATVGNYDYGFYWYLYQDGTIQLEVKLTGIIQTAAITPGADYPFGGMVAEGLGGPNHQHFFCARLHMMVDGEHNSVTEHEYHPRPWGTDNPYGNVFDVTARTLSRELDACREADGRTGRFWKVINPNRRNAVGKHPGYKLMAQPSPLLLAQAGSSIDRRGGFASKHLWVTPYAEEERYATGNYPNQHAGGDGLPAWVQQNRPIENEDIVVWHSFGHSHVCKPEDFPIMPVEYAGFMLKPNNFFAANPAMDLPGEMNGHSVRHGERTASCCGGEPGFE
jgi:primary-amine oxidase